MFFVNIGTPAFLCPSLRFISTAIFLKPPPVRFFTQLSRSLYTADVAMDYVEADNPSTTPSSDNTSMKRPAEAAMPEAEVKRIHLNPVRGTEVVRRKRRKFALLLSYCGKGYLGMQSNPGMKTIEGDLLMAMLKADLIDDESYECPHVFKFQRASRTDKGVSAARQVVSAKLPEDVPDIAAAINEYLNDQIRVMAVRRTTKGFNCKTWCDARTYSYMCPTFAFAPVEEMTKEDYRITPEVLEKLREYLKMYKGTHNFHNFTAQKKYEDASAFRYIIDFDCGEPFERDGLEWVVLKVKGQSFMLHQIRKMVGLVMAISRGLTSPDVITRAYGKERVDVPIAPGLGLVLEELHFEKYKLRYGTDGIHKPLSWDEVEDNIKEFREKYIDSTIATTEIEERSMFHWLATLPFHCYDEVDTPQDKHVSRVNTPIGKAALTLKKYREEEAREKDEKYESEVNAARVSDEECKQDVNGRESTLEKRE